MLKMFNMFDSKVETYTTPVYFRSTEEYKRFIYDRLQDKDPNVPPPYSTLAQHPQDFKLFELGSYDVNTGKLQVYESPRHLTDAHLLAKQV